MKISVCSDCLFKNVDYRTAMETLADNGFKDIEFWSWWNKDLQVLESLRREKGIHFTAFCTKFLSLVDDSQHEAYLQGLKESIEACKLLGCTVLISQVGNAMPHVSNQVQHVNLVNGLKKAAPILEAAGVTLAVEPLNTRVDHQGYYLWDADEAFAIIDEVGSPNVKVLFDLYHQQISQGDMLRRIKPNIDKIAHFHAASVPGRHEPFLGEINYANIDEAINRMGYAGYVGLEYSSVGPVIEGLERMRDIFTV